METLFESGMRVAQMTGWGVEEHGATWFSVNARLKLECELGAKGG